MELEDLSSAREGHRRFFEPTLANALEFIDRFGLAILRRAFDPNLIAGLLANAARYGSLVDAATRSGITPQFAPFHALLPRPLACNLSALDPITAELQADDFTRTTLCAAMMSELFRDLLVEILGPHSGWALARARAVIPKLDGINGRLHFHMEKTEVRFPGVYNIWTPLTPAEIVTNIDAPGIQFYLGRLEYLTSEPDEAVSDFVRTLSLRADTGDIAPTDEGFFTIRSSMPAMSRFSQARFRMPALSRKGHGHIGLAAMSESFPGPRSTICRIALSPWASDPIPCCRAPIDRPRRRRANGAARVT